MYVGVVIVIGSLLLGLLSGQIKEICIFYSFNFFFLNSCIYLLAVLGLRCCTRAFPSCGKRGLLFVAVCGLLITVASLC